MWIPLLVQLLLPISSATISSALEAKRYQSNRVFYYRVCQNTQLTNCYQEKGGPAQYQETLSSPSRMSCYYKKKISTELNSVLIDMVCSLCSDSSSFFLHRPIDRLTPVCGPHHRALLYCEGRKNNVFLHSDLQIFTGYLASNADA